MFAPDISARNPQAERDDDIQDQQQTKHLKIFEADVEYTMQQYCTCKTRDNDNGSLLCRMEFCRSECKSPDAGENDMAGNV